MSEYEQLEFDFDTDEDKLNKLLTITEDYENTMKNIMTKLNEGMNEVFSRLNNLNIFNTNELNKEIKPFTELRDIIKSKSEELNLD